MERINKFDGKKKLLFWREISALRKRKGQLRR